MDVRIAAWRAAYVGLMPADYLAGMDIDRAEAARRLATRLTVDSSSVLLVGLDAEGVVAGMCTFGPGRDEDATAAGQLIAINVHPRVWGTGLGAALFAAAVDGLASYPLSYLWVVAGNARARRFYQRHGWYADGASRWSDAFGIGFTEVRYRRPGS